jgi:GPH family glycoside/pentoside/hexuronide:cation symporter
MMYFLKYRMGLAEGSALTSGFVTAGMVTNIVGGFTAALIARRLDKTRALPLLHLFAALFAGASVLVGGQSIEMALGIHVLWSFVTSASVPLVWAMITDTVDYGAAHTGKRTTGMIFAVNMFFLKLGLAMGGAIVGWVLAGFGYLAGAETQSTHAVFGIELCFGLLPAAASVFLVLVARLYRLDQSRMKEIEGSARLVQQTS